MSKRLLICVPLVLSLAACKDSTAKYSIGPKADLHGIVFGKKAFSNKDLTGANLTDANINSVDFSGALLTSADLTRVTANKDTILKRANFDSATKRNPSCDHCDVRSVWLHSNGSSLGK